MPATDIYARSWGHIWNLVWPRVGAHVEVRVCNHVDGRVANIATRVRRQLEIQYGGR